MALLYTLLATAAATLLILTNITAEQAAVGKSQSVDELVENVKVSVRNISDQLQTALGIPDINTNQTELYQTFVNHSKVLGDQVQDFMNKVHAAATDKDGLLAPILTQLNETASTLHSAEFEQKTKGLKDTVTTSINTIATQFAKVAGEVKKESQPDGSLYQISQSALEKFVEITKRFESKVKEAVDKKQ